MVLVLGRLPRPKAQVSIYDGKGRFVGRPDLYYDEARLGVEYDGAVHRMSLAEDDRRQNRLLNAGVRLLRFTCADVLGDAGTNNARGTHHQCPKWQSRVWELGVVGEVRAEPALHLGGGHALALRVVLDLVAPDFADHEVAGLGVGEVQAGDRSGRGHGS